eukprot:13253847-Ditylum_brightwellii.AAC.1
MAGNQANNSEEATSDTQQTMHPMPMEISHLKMGHRSIRSLMAVSLYQVWSDYELAPKTDEFCKGC